MINVCKGSLIVERHARGVCGSLLPSVPNGIAGRSGLKALWKKGKDMITANGYQCTCQSA